MPHITLLPYAATNSFSNTVLQYLEAAPELNPFYAFRADKAGISAAISAREKSNIDRSLLAEVLREQYSSLPHEQAVADNIERLRSEHTFTICTAHQPNLCTGYLYFVYKILHAVKLAQTLQKDFPDKHFIPVYYMGSEDADLDELGTFRYGDKKFVWDAAGQKGAVGHMSTSSLKPLLDELFSIMGPPGEDFDRLQEIFTEAYLKHGTIAAATQYLVHRLFGRYGLVVLDPDDARLKRLFIPVMKEDLLEHSAERISRQSIDLLHERGFKSQAHPRSINLFYLSGDIRQRIEQRGANDWAVIDTDIHFSKEELLQELEMHPERFSPNVILRPLYQEIILPNVVFIGGGAEVAYWLQLNDLFVHNGVFYPAIALRQSFLWINRQAAMLREKAGIEVADLFKDEHELVNRLSRAAMNLDLDRTSATFLSILADLNEKVAAIDSTLDKSVKAAGSKIMHQLAVIEKKALRAQKRKLGVEVDRIQRLKTLLFPGGNLQERTENFIPYYLQHGAAFFDTLLSAMPASYGHQFVVIEA